MDARLYRIRGQRPTFLRKQELPALARALVAYFAGRARAHREFFAGVAVIHLQSESLSIVVRGEDWEKLIPFLKDRSSLPSAWRPEPAVVVPQDTRIDGPEEAIDRNQYDRILRHLELLFTEEFPTSQK